MLTRVSCPAWATRSQMKRVRFSSVGGPSASILLRNLWSSDFCTSAKARSSRPRSVTMPVTGSAMPRMVTSERNEWPWISSLASPSVVPGRACAASNLNAFVSSHMSCPGVVGLSDAECLVCLQAEQPLRMAQAIIDDVCGIPRDVRSVHRLQREALEAKIGEILRAGPRLGVDQLELMALPD